MTTLKAFTVFPAPDKSEGGLLVFHETRNKARMLGKRKWPGMYPDSYIDFYANRAPLFDKYVSELSGPVAFDSPSDMPKHWEPFFRDEII